MVALKTTEFEEILGGAYETPCYVDAVETFKHALEVRRPIVVLFGDDAIKGISEFAKIAKRKRNVRTSSFSQQVLQKTKVVFTAINIGISESLYVTVEELELGVRETVQKFILDNIEKFKDYYILLDENNNRIIFLSKKIRKDSQAEIIENIYIDFPSVTS